MNKSLLYIGILLAALSSCQTPYRACQGDLLFMVGESGEITDAITSATGKSDSLNFSHVGIFLPAADADSVLEATTEGGVRMTALADFLDRAAKIGGKPVVVAMRLRDTTGTAAAIRRAKGFLKYPYDYSFLPDNGKFYCSELVWVSYLAPDGSHLFRAQPMNFRAPDGTMPEFWTELFDKLGEPIPQGIPGTNPNDMSKEPSLVCVHRYF